MKKSKVIGATPNGTWDGKNGLNYKFEVEMENGDIGEYSSISKDQTKFVIGETVDYIFEDGKYPKIKPVYLNPTNSFQKTFNPQREELIVRQCALKASVDLAIAKGMYKHDDILTEAQILTDWVMNRKQDLPFS